jgi:hypothetical protein
VEIKCQLDATDEFLLQILLLAQHVSGHLYAHHQELESIIEVVAACRIWCSLVFKLSVRCGAEGCVSGLRAAALLKPDTQPSAPHRTDNLKTKERQIRQAATTSITLSSS